MDQARYFEPPEMAAARLDLPSPVPMEERSLLGALWARRTIRNIAPTVLPERLLGNLLWAANGVNRLRGPFGEAGRTAPSASNSQEVAVYVALPAGCYRYDPGSHALLLAADRDLRAAALASGQRESFAVPPVQLIYIADASLLRNAQYFSEGHSLDAETQKAFYHVDCGLIAGNVGLYAAAAGLAAWLHDCDRSILQDALQLGATQHALFAHSIGYPAAQYLQA